MRAFLREFREFIDQGNIMDMAVGIIIGGAFTTLVKDLISDIINPIITAATGGTGDTSGWSIAIPGSSQAVDFGAFVSALINFVLVALVVFLLLRSYNRAKKMAADAAAKAAALASEKLGVDVMPEEEKGPRTCPYCGQELADEAIRCPHCTSILPNATAEQVRAMEGKAPSKAAEA
jgi:large conductance mechanosensitive channel